MALRGLVTSSFECISLVKYLLTPQTDITMTKSTDLKGSLDAHFFTSCYDSLGP